MKENKKILENIHESHPLEKMIFCSEEKEKEWADLDPVLKSSIMSNLRYFADRSENKASIEMLCHVVQELLERVKKIEEINKTPHPWARFLNARRDAMMWMREEMNRSDKEIANDLCIDEMQVYLILEASHYPVPEGIYGEKE